jgi:hypothetical protein
LTKGDLGISISPRGLQSALFHLSSHFSASFLLYSAPHYSTLLYKRYTHGATDQVVHVFHTVRRRILQVHPTNGHTHAIVTVTTKTVPFQINNPPWSQEPPRTARKGGLPSRQPSANTGDTWGQEADGLERGRARRQTRTGPRKTRPARRRASRPARPTRRQTWTRARKQEHLGAGQRRGRSQGDRSAPSTAATIHGPCSCGLLPTRL